MGVGGGSSIALLEVELVSRCLASDRGKIKGDLGDRTEKRGEITYSGRNFECSGISR